MQALHQLRQVSGEITFNTQHRPAGGARLGHAGVQPLVAPSEHRVGDLVGDDRADAAQVGADLFDLAYRLGQELQVAVERAGRRVVIPSADEVVDQYLR